MKLGGKTVAFILLFVALVLVTYLGSQFSARLDLTSDKIYTLSPGSRQLLAKLEEPLVCTFYFSRGVGGREVPISFKNFGTRIEEMLHQFAAASQGHIKVTVIDPQPDTDEESAARSAGLKQIPLSNGDSIFLGLVVTQGSEEKTIQFFENDREQFLEYDIAKLVFSVQQVDRPKLGLISSLPLKGAPMMMPGQPPPQDQVAISEWENTYEVVTVEESATELPADLDLLAVVHPQEVTEKLQYAIDQFLLAGKPVLLAVDPSSFYMRQTQQRQQQMMMQQPPQTSASNLPKLLVSYGITYDQTNVVGDLEGAMAAGNATTPANNPTWMQAGPERFSKIAQATSNLKSMWLIEAGALSVATDRGYEITPLIETSDRAGVMQSMMLGFMQPADIGKSFKPEGGKRTVAVLLHGSFKTAFPLGAPKDPEPTADENKPAEEKPAEPAKPADAAPALQISTKPSTLVVVADSDWLLDYTSVQRIEQLNAYMPRNDNLAFATNLADFLAGSEDLIAIRGKGRSQRPFDVIEKMENSAQEQYQAAMTEVEKRLADIQQEINKLAQDQTNAQQIVAAPEVRDALEKYRDQEAAARAERRTIRRQLREGIEGLQNRLTIANLLVVPAGLIALGIYGLLSRHARRKPA